MPGYGWFSTSFDYSGEAEAVFQDPPAIMTGHASVKFSDDGSPVIKMAVTSCDHAFEDRIDRLSVLLGSGHSMVGKGVRQVTFGGGIPNCCTCVTVKSPGGVFRAGPCWPSGDLNEVRDGRPMVHLQPGYSEFQASDSEEKYWVLPLSNFVSEFASPWPDPGTHPLSFFKQPTRIIRFEANGEDAFIQPLPHHRIVMDRLRSGRIRSGLTAVAIAQMAGPHMTDPKDWFLTVFLRLLSLTTGSSVGAPWIELRDGAGRLVRRCHCPLNQGKNFVEGYANVRESLDVGTGEILKRGLASPVARRPFFRVALKHCVSAGRKGASLEEQIVPLVIALDGLCRPELVNDHPAVLPVETKEQIRKILDESQSKVQALAETVPQPMIKDRIMAVSDRIGKALDEPEKLRVAVPRLLERFAFRDLELLNAYYGVHPLRDKKDWLGVLSYYRNMVVHEGSIAAGSLEPVGDVLGFLLHLYDLIVRILLKLIGYSGRYQPRLVRGTSGETVDWFQQGFPVENVLKIQTLEP